MRKFNHFNNIKGQALMIVVTVLAMLFIITMAFFVLSQTERNAAIRHLDSLRAQYIAEAGITYAQKVLQLDKEANLVDSLEDAWVTKFQGLDADLDQDGVNESKWFNLNDSQGNPFGRFGVIISDEASRINLNSTSDEVLSRLFSSAGIETSKASLLVSRRPFNAKEEISHILGKENFSKVKDLLTIYSRDLEVGLSKNRRVYLNTSQARGILEPFLNAGIKDSYQKAANLKDAADTDFNQTILDKFSQTFTPTGLSEAGGWVKVGNFYEAYPENDAVGTFAWSNLAIEDGDYLCFLHGALSTDIVAGDPPLFSGEGVAQPVKVQGGSFTLAIKPAKGATSKFSYVELMSLAPKNGLARRLVTGTEALVINEVMVKPSKEILVDNPSQIAPGESRDWSIQQVTAGTYYLIFEAITVGGLVGDVSISGGPGQSLRDQDYFPTTVTVTSGGEINIRIKNNSLQEASFKGVKILQEPDGEFIEILNLSAGSIDLSGFSVEVYTTAGELVSGWPAQIPSNAKVEPYQHLILVIDNNDSSPAPLNLRGNRISFYGIYNTNATGLIFNEASAINKENDLLPNSGGKVILKDNLGERIDAIEYQSSQIKDFTSLERGDPSQTLDADGNGFFDGWNLSSSVTLSTPGLPNENGGMYTRNETGELIKHNVSEISVFNRSLTDLAEVVQLSSGENWRKFTLQDIALMADHFACEAVNLEMAGHEQQGGADTTGIWEFLNIPQGNYLLSVLSNNAQLQGKEIQVAIKTSATTDFSDLQPLLFMQGFAFYGFVNLPETPTMLQVKILTESLQDKTGLQGIQLEPVFSVTGRVNINTAKPEILRSLLVSESLVNAVTTNRPIGANGTRFLGLGELFLLDSGFIPFHKYLTVKSDVYEIESRGDCLQQGKTVAYQTIRTVLERGD